MTIEFMIEETIGKEGRYSNHPSDTGGPTMWGITEFTARKHGYLGKMQDLPRVKAVAIYRQEYVIDPGFAKVEEISPLVAQELFDTGVNAGPDVPARWFQEWLNIFNKQGQLYPDIKEDAQIGPGTLAAFRSFLKARGPEAEKVMFKMLNCDQGAFYKRLSQRRQANEDFTWGWARARVA